MATDTSFGEVRKFEDFLVTAIGDLPEIDVLDATTSAVAITIAADGRVRLTNDNGDDDDRTAVGFGALNWTAGDGYLKMEARIILSAITDNKFFVGFKDAIPSTDEANFDATLDAVTITTAADGIGILFDNDATTANFWCVAAATSVVTASKSLGSAYNPVAATPITLGVYLSLDRKSAVWYIDGVEVYRIDANSTALVAAVALCPLVYSEAQGTAFNLDVDYIYASKGRSAT